MTIRLHEDEHSHGAQMLITHVDDSVTVSRRHGSEYDHGPVLDFVKHINASKTSETFTDFQRRPRLPAPGVIEGEVVAAVQVFGH